MMSTKEQHNYQTERSQENPKNEGKKRKKRRNYTHLYTMVTSALCKNDRPEIFTGS